MGLNDIVKMTSYLTRVENLAGFGAVRDRHLGDHHPTSTLLVIQALARPEFLVEVEVMAAKE
jgi:enamine deaminase RidA (YjgF/YER057c/UK114 family)